MFGKLQYFLLSFCDLCSFSGSLNKDGQALHNTSVLAEYIEGMRLVLETEGDKDSPTLHEIRLHYSGLVSRLIKSIPGKLLNCSNT